MDVSLHPFFFCYSFPSFFVVFWYFFGKLDFCCDFFATAQKLEFSELFYFFHLQQLRARATSFVMANFASVELDAVAQLPGDIS
jgi:hypothetical protein